MKILIADDENIILEPMCDYLSAKGFEVLTANNGKAAVSLAENEQLDLILLDVMMPIMDGVEACAEIRKFSDTPILFLSALGEEKDFLRAYRNGCDDYIVKPFPLAVLYEKCLTMIKRYRHLNADNKITVGAVTVDMVAGRAYVKDEEIRLTSRDFTLLCFLLENRNIILNRELILTKVWGYDFDGDVRVVDTHIKRLRKSLGDGADVIKTVFGVGYTVEEVQE